MKTIEFWISLVGAIVVAFIIAIWVPGKPDDKVRFAIEYAGLVLTFLFGFLVLAAIASGKIDITHLLDEKSADPRLAGGASMSRFQLLIFTVVIAISFFLIVVNTHKFPDNISPQVLALLGISASTYAVSKGIQASTGSGNGGSAGATTNVGSSGGSQTVIVQPPAENR